MPELSDIMSDIISLCKGDCKLYSNEILGFGSNSVVYKGEYVYKGENRPVAIKEIFLKFLKIDFPKREIENMNSVNHPNILKIYYATEEKGNCYLILPLCKKETLQSKLKEKGKFSEEEAASFIRPILDAVAYLHENCIVHRDIKAGNILFSNEDEVLLSDFGWSKKIDVDAPETYAGTIEYMAPEVMKNSGQHYDNKCDIWSIGILAYHLVYGKVPFNARNIDNCIKQMEERKYTLNGGSEYFQDFVKSCLNPTPSERPTANDLLNHRFITEN